MAENEVVLNQKNTFGVDTQIKLIDGRELKISNKGKKLNQSFSIDILSLTDKSKKTVCIAWKWLAASIGFILVTMVLLKFPPDVISSNKNLYSGLVMLMGILGSILCFVNFWKKTLIKQIFYSRNANVPIITLCAGKPTKKTFSDFVAAVENRIKKFRSHMNIAEDKQLMGEMKMLRRLSERGVISKQTYEKAKSKLFSGYSDSSA